MGVREALAFAILPLVVGGIIFLPPWVYLAMLWFVTMMAARELLVLLRRLQHPAPLAPSLLLLGLALPAVWVGGLPSGVPVLAAALLLPPVVYLLGGYPVRGAAAGIAGATFTVVYFVVTGGAMGFLRTLDPGTMGVKVLLFHCLLIWGGDSGAYYVGSRFGRHKLAPVVSPKKSWEGIAGGILGTFFGLWFCRTLFFPELPLPLGLAIATALSVLAPVGDLVESLFKRDAGAKDSSDLLPGHGGFLDRSDSLFFAAPFVLALFILFGVLA